MCGNQKGRHNSLKTIGTYSTMMIMAYRKLVCQYVMRGDVKRYYCSGFVLLSAFDT